MVLQKWLPPPSRLSLVCTDFEYLSHEVGEEEHVAEEGRPSQQVTDAQVAVMAGHVDEGPHEGPQCHPLLGLRTRGSSVTHQRSQPRGNKNE